jgi:CDP-glucose 4,6-dehydratase
MVGKKSPLEDMGVNPIFWKDRVVFLTGHTGFKGGWMAMWLTHMGAKVHGYALTPPTTPNFFTVNQLEKSLYKSSIGDIRDLATLSVAMEDAQPSVVIHMAAQPLVRESYNTPVNTFATNVMGTVHLLEAARHTASVEAVVIITTDKCYENMEWLWPYRENDRLGGYDPYSNSKACTELVTAAYRSSFFEKTGKRLATARAGNVIGGGDWANDRLIPDFFRAMEVGKALRVRSPNAVRPWQHVLEPVCGYLQLAESLFEQGTAYNGAWNFGPEELDAKPVSYVADYLCQKISYAQWEREQHPQPHEAGLLKLDSSKAKNELNWRPRWSLETALNATVDWHLAWKSGLDMPSFTINQIEEYILSE